MTRNFELPDQGEILPLPEQQLAKSHKSDGFSGSEIGGDSVRLEEELNSENSERAGEITTQIVSEAGVLGNALGITDGEGLTRNGLDLKPEVLPDDDQSGSRILNRFNKFVRSHIEALTMATIVAGVIAGGTKSAEASGRYGQSRGRQVIGMVTREVGRSVDLAQRDDLRQRERDIRDIEIRIRSIDREIRLADNELRNTMRTSGRVRKEPVDVDEIKQGIEERINRLVAERDSLIQIRAEQIREYNSRRIKWEIAGVAINTAMGSRW